MAKNVNFCVWSVVSERTFSKKFPAEAKEAETVAGGFSLDLTSSIGDDHARSQSQLISTEEIGRSVPHQAQCYGPTTTCTESRGLPQQGPWKGAPSISC